MNNLHIKDGRSTTQGPPVTTDERFLFTEAIKREKLRAITAESQRDARRKERDEARSQLAAMMAQAEVFGEKEKRYEADRASLSAVLANVARLGQDLIDCRDLCREQAETIAELKAGPAQGHPYKQIWDALETLQWRVDALEGRREKAK